jgi:hypothetical protein
MRLQQNRDHLVHHLGDLVLHRDEVLPQLMDQSCDMDQLHLLHPAHHLDAV